MFHVEHRERESAGSWSGKYEYRTVVCKTKPVSRQHAGQSAEKVLRALIFGQCERPGSDRIAPGPLGGSIDARK
jgi:hypothetical protein